MAKPWKGMPKAVRGKRMSKRKRQSSTAGKTKGENCRASKTSRMMAKWSRAYKTQEYAVWCTAKDAMNRSGMAIK